ncbi:MAG TPA: hypothetical protein DCQ56_05725 [Porphyromonadaceae bacterium]|nr:hypothetical protein [Porphyromonadaceae bacterium]
MHFKETKIDYVMKSLKAILLWTVLALTMTACSNVSEKLEKMIPSDATGVISIDVPQILNKASFITDGKLQVPADLRTIIDENDASALCQVIDDLPYMGVNQDSKAYMFFTSKTLGQVLLVALSDPKLAHEVVERRSGGDFNTVGGVECIYVKDYLYAIHDKVLLIGRVNKAVPVEKAAAAAQAMFEHNQPSIAENNDVMKHLAGDAAVQAYLELKAVKSLLHKSATYNELTRHLPLLDIFVESDIQAMTMALRLEERQATLETTIIADENSEYLTLMKTLTAAPDASVLKAVPNSMDYTVSMSVHGAQFVQLPQIKQLITLFKGIPYIGRIDIEGILSSVDGPLTVAAARDPHLAGEWNAVVAAKSTRPEEILKSIGTFATALGQAPEIYDGEYIYQYDNKMIKMGVTDGVLYIKMLDYEQTEGYAHELPAVRELFGKSSLACFVQTRQGGTDACFEFGMADHLNGNGRFYTKSDTANATLELLKVMCAIKSGSPYDDNNEADANDLSDIMGGAIDQLQPVN